MKNNLLSWINKNRDPNIASNLKRLFAFIIDYFIGSIFVSFIPMILVSIITQEKVITVNLMKTIPFDMQLICCIVSIILAVYYYCIIPLNPKHLGQTLGKRIMKIKVVKMNGSNITLTDILKREILGAMLIEGETTFPSAYFRNILYQFMPAFLSQALGWLSIIISIISIVVGYLGINHRMIHDFIANTKVIKA